ncbi:sensor histidine kinase [Hutsoniella sourekii]
MKREQMIQEEVIELTNGEKFDIAVKIIWRLFQVALAYFLAVLLYPRIIGYNFGGVYGNNIYWYFVVNHDLRIDGSNFYNAISMVALLVAIIVAYRSYEKEKARKYFDHVQDYIHYFAQGNYDKRIPKVENSQTNKIITSINQLVASTQAAIEEERRIEQTKDELIANVSHDIRTPLTSIVGYLGAVIDQQYSNDQEMQQFIQIAYDKTKTMVTLVNDLFLYTDSRQASYEINKQDIPAEIYLTQIAAEFYLSANQKGIDIITQIEPEDLVLSIDVEKMARVISNLLSNALKYGYGADKVKVVAYQEDTHTIIEVRNNGQVLEKGEEDKIFERSYRTEKSRKASEPGSGLGLAIVSNIVDLHGGQVSASVEDNETVFRIQLPPKDNNESDVLDEISV